MMLSIVIPCFNEEKRVRKTVNKVVDFLLLKKTESRVDTSK